MTQVLIGMTDHEFKGYALVLSGADPTTGGVAIVGSPQPAWLELSLHHIIRTLKLNQLGTVLNADFQQ